MSKKSWVRTIYERLKYSFTELKILQNYKKKTCMNAFNSLLLTRLIHYTCMLKVKSNKNENLVWFGSNPYVCLVLVIKRLKYSFKCSHVEISITIKYGAKSENLHIIRCAS